MKHLFLVLLLLPILGISQESWEDFTGKERAFFYHISRKTENLNAEIFPLFEYTDSIPYINDTLPDYKYVEKKIVRYPERLVFHTDQLARKSVGLVSDLASKFALWELDAVLHYRNTNSMEDKTLKDKLKVYNQYVLEEVPQSAVRTLSGGEFVLEKSLQGYYSPSLTIGDKKAAIANSSFSLSDQTLILNSLMIAQQKYVEVRTREIMKVFGVEPEVFRNFLSATGDGDNWSEIEAGFKTPYNRSLPDDIALFNFETEVLTQEKSEIDYVSVMSVTNRTVTTSASEKTMLHFDVAGYHPERQTTLVIQKGDRSYILYGKNEHRLVSPDSTYGEGATYWRLMWELENIHIAELKENLYGKRGYEHWIDVYEKRIEGTLLQIKKTEYKLDQLRRKPNPPPKMKKKKIKKKNLGNSDQDGQGHPTGAMTKLDKQRNATQKRLVELNSLLENEKRILEKLKKEMEEAYFILVKYETLLDKMQKNMGYAVMEYERENDMFIFKDGATFNYRTQDFTFPPTQRAEAFQVLHITFGKSVFATAVEENFVHMSQAYVAKKQEHAYKKVIRDYDAAGTFTTSDSIQTMELFKALMRKGVELNISAYAGGILGGNNGDYFRDSTMMPSNYQKENTAKASVIEYFGTYGAHVDLQVTFWRNGMLPFDYSGYEKGYLKANKKDARINRIDYLTGVIAKQMALAWIESLKTKAQEWIEDSGDRLRIMTKLTTAKIKKVKFLNGQVEVPVKVIEPTN